MSPSWILRVTLLLASGLVQVHAFAAQGDVPAAATDAQAEALDERLDALLGQTLPADAYRETSNCLSRRRFRDVEIVSDGYLVFHDGMNYWLNRLRTRCPLLTERMFLTFRTGTQSVCDGDAVFLAERFDIDRGIDPTGRPVVTRGTCILGRFEEISEPQARLLEELFP